MAWQSVELMVGALVSMRVDVSAVVLVAVTVVEMDSLLVAAMVAATAVN